MDEKAKSSRLTAISLGALIGLLSALFVLVLQRLLRPSIRLDRENQVQPYDSGPISASFPNPPARRAPVSTYGYSVPPSADGACTVTGPRWSTPTKYIMGVILFLGALLVLFIGRGVIPMVIFAALLALFVNPFIEKLDRKSVV